MPRNTLTSDTIPPPPGTPEELMTEAVTFVAKLAGKKLPEAPHGGFVHLYRGRLRIIPSRLRKDYYDFILLHQDQLKEIARVTPKPSPPPVRYRRPKSAARQTKAEALAAKVQAFRERARREAEVEERTSAPATSPPRVSNVAQPKTEEPKVASPIDTTDSPRPRPVVPKEPEPEFYVEGYRITEHDVRSMLSWFGDEELAAYDEGRVSKDIAYAQTAASLRDSVRIGGHVVWRGHSGEVHMFPERKLLSEIVDWQRRMGFLRSR